MKITLCVMATCLVLYVMITSVFLSIKKKRHNETFKSNRDPIKTMNTVENFVSDNHILPSQYKAVVEVIETITGLPKELILPTDRFGKEIFIEQPQMSGESDKDWIIEDLGLLNHLAIEEEVDNIATVGDMVLLYSKYIKT